MDYKPKGCHSVVPSLTVKGAAEALEFYKRALGAEEVSRMPGPGGILMHAEFRIGDTLLMMADEFPGAVCRSPQSLGGTTMNLHVYVEDVDKAYERAVAAGATAVMPPADQFWGDRWGLITDPYGHSWGLATHKEDVSHDELMRRGQAFANEMCGDASTKSRTATS
jgi:uncharacterized glyoxalase superfamily protein PhnB